MERINQRPLLLGQQLLRRQQHDEKGAAQELLAKIYIWFTEQFNTRARQEAKVLLHDLPQAGSLGFMFATLGVFPSGSLGVGCYLHPLLLGC